ncbi:hypothetical protein GCM10011367_12440 [Marinicauda pacifica]|uniref:Uncharacterized protein n=1 Tax=Marinicauda pacifica TaxID=1133559 RepID=A0A4S2HFN7_9PROT|nr:hypothetical protein [Marinicauda pacifica]TGY94866.1 hypothetical protein E5162_06290 [Marinicauda pacifica]GGE39469.1 hypothetical protein GCM10011367_12440 [Marinicauda pacifica]
MTHPGDSPETHGSDETQTGAHADGPGAVNPVERTDLSAQDKAQRNKRNLAIAFGLVAFVVLIFSITVMRLASNISAGG